MFSRRGFFAAAAGLTAGVFCWPGQAVAGLFRRRRCVVTPCCPCVPSRGVYIGITYPQPNDTNVPRDFKATGWYCLPDRSAAAVRCWARATGRASSPGRWSRERCKTGVRP